MVGERVSVETEAANAIRHACSASPSFIHDTLYVPGDATAAALMIGVRLDQSKPACLPVRGKRREGGGKSVKWPLLPLIHEIDATAGPRDRSIG